jgi:hypothetical protein
MQQELLLLRFPVQVSEEELKSMLRRAYEGGRSGFLEGMEDCVAGIVSDFRPASPSEPYGCVTTTTFAPSSNPNAAGPYYFYSTMTLPPPQSGGRAEIV